MAETVTLGDGCALAYELRVQSGKPILILAHALGTTMALFDAQVEALAADFTILRYDMRGHGASDAPPGAYSMDRLGRDLLELMDHLEIEKAHLAGVSLGAMVGQWAGVRAPGRFDKLVLANTSASMPPPNAWDDRIKACYAHGMEPMAAPALERWFTPEFIAKADQAVEGIADMIKATPVAGYTGCCAAIRDMDLRPTAALIERPSLILYGERDPATPSDHAQFLADTIPGARAVGLDAAHLANIECPEAFTAAMRDFLIAA